MSANSSAIFNGTQQIEHFLGSANGKGRNDHIAATVKSFLENLGQLANIVRPRSVGAVAIGRFNHHIICIFRHLGIPNQRPINISQIAGKQDRTRLPSVLYGQANTGRAQQMACIGERKGKSLLHRGRFSIGHRFE